MCKFSIVKDILSRDDLFKVLQIKVDGLENFIRDEKSKSSEQVEEMLTKLKAKYGEFHF
jgi:hypothetical protein